jgi:hypothetical protein
LYSIKSYRFFVGCSTTIFTALPLVVIILITFPSDAKVGANSPLYRLTENNNLCRLGLIGKTVLNYFFASAYLVSLTLQRYNLFFNLQNLFYKKAQKNKKKCKKVQKKAKKVTF